MIAGIISLLVGCVTLLSGVNHWRYRNEETVNLMEAAILRATGEEPFPRTKADSILKWVHIVLGFTLGLFFLFTGVLVILYQLDLL